MTCQKFRRGQKFRLAPAPVITEKSTPAPGPFFIQNSDSGFFSGKYRRLLPESAPSLRFRDRFCNRPVLSEISDFRIFWLHAMCTGTEWLSTYQIRL